MTTKRSILAASVLAILVGGLAVTARGHGPHGDGARLAGFGPRGPRVGGLVQRLIFPCRAGCAEDGHDCTDTALADAVACAEQACAAEIAATQIACQADRTSDECATTRTALATCAQSCLEGARDALAACRTTAEDCATACGNT